MPSRIQISRNKGARLPDGAVIVDRRTCWGNPFKPGMKIIVPGRFGSAGSPYDGEWPVGEYVRGGGMPPYEIRRVRDTADAVELFADYIRHDTEEWPLPAIRHRLGGRDLACWCKPGDPCHADVLLALANSEPQMTELEAVLAAGLAWLHRTVQPDDAIITHHGISHFVGDRRLQFACGIVIVHVVHPRFDTSWTCLNPLDDGEANDIAATIERLGYGIAARWNGGPGCDTASFRLTTQGHPSLVAAWARYRAGCPKHHTVFCGRQGRTDDERACTWYRDGCMRIVPPSWPEAATGSAECPDSAE